MFFRGMAIAGWHKFLAFAAMSLSLYKQKRSFEKTPEPSGKKVATSKALKFVVQKHDASRLHYDFRLEMEGVLKSWAVPKGPSLNPEDKRLAVMVEDHPFDYRTFEGIIPPGNYGAGTVIVWDEGTYEPSEVEGSVKEQEKALLKQLNSGNLKIRLHGEKLNGDYALVRTKGMDENAWLLIKKNDEFASSKDVTKKDASVKSGKTIEQMSAGRTIKQSPGKTSTTKKNVNKKTATKKAASKNAVTKKSSPLKKKSRH